MLISRLSSKFTLTQIRKISCTSQLFMNTKDKIAPVAVEENAPKKLVLTGNKKVDEKLDIFTQKLFQLMGIYEEMIGLKELKEAQKSVIDAEARFIEAQESRRTLSRNLLNLQMKLKELRDQMDRLNRTDSNYLKLFTQEHENLNQEKILQHDYKLKESEERDLFFRLSALLRESQEKERARAERIKYLQLTLSIACTCLGLLSAFLISFLRRSEIKEIMEHEKDSFHTVITKLDTFDKEQREANEIFKQILLDNQKIFNPDEILNKQEKILNDFINSNQTPSSSTNSSGMLAKQQDLLKLVAIASVISTAFMSVIYFKGT